MVKIHGLRGDLKIIPWTWRPERFKELPGLWCRTVEGENLYLTVKRVRIGNSAIFIRFEEASKHELAEALVGSEIFIDESDRARLPEGMYYHDDLVGCEVTCERYGELGQVVEVLDQAGHDIWRVEGPKGEVLLPAVKAMIKQVDIERGRILVDLPEGLVVRDT